MSRGNEDEMKVGLGELWWAVKMKVVRGAYGVNLSGSKIKVGQGWIIGGLLEGGRKRLGDKISKR